MGRPSASMSEPQDLSPDRLDDETQAFYEYINISTDGEEFLDELFMDSTTSDPSLRWPLCEGISDTTHVSTDFEELAIPITISKNVPLQAYSSLDSGYGGSEAARRTPSRRRDKPSKQQDKPSKGVKEHPWGCQLCDKSYIRELNLRKHERTIHNIRFPSGTEKHSQKEESCFLAKAQDDKMTKSIQSNLRDVTLYETSPLQISKDELGGTPVTVGLIHRLESCLSELGSQSTKGFRIPLVIKTNGFTTNINIDVYDKSQTLPSDSGTTQSEPSPGDIKKSEPELRSEQLQLPPPPSPRQVLKVRRRRASLAVDYDNLDAVMDQQPITTIEAPEIMSDPHTSLILSPSKDLAHPSSKDEAKLMGHRKSDNLNESIKVEASEIEAPFSKKRKNPDDDASHCSGSLVDSGEEEDDSEYDCDNIITWNCSQHDALPSFLPYIRGCDENTSPPCTDSPQSGSTTSRTASDTPASSSASGLTGGNGLQGSNYTPPSAGTGFPNNGSNPVLGTKEGFGAKVADPQPRPLICWYPAAGIACNAKHISSSSKTRYLWCDHAWGKSREGPNHRLPDACQLCKRLFLTQKLLEEHVQNIISKGPCQPLSDIELEEFNREPNKLGISLECEAAVEKIRTYINKETKGDKLPVFRDGDIEKLLKSRVDINALKQRVDSNVLLYINGSNTNEGTARSELWKWYLIFKKLRPDDELPRNPFIPAQRLAEPEGKSRADALCTFMQVFDQRRMEGCLSQLDDDQRTALNCVFLDTWDMLVAKKASKRHRSIQTRNPQKRQKRSPPEDHEPAPDSTDPALAPTTPAQAPRQLQQQQQQEEEADDAYLLFDVDDFDIDQFLDRLPRAPNNL